MKYKDAKTLYDAIKNSSGNKELYAICTEIITTIKKQTKKIKSVETLDPKIDFEDKSLTRTHVLNHLFQQSEDGNATASNYLGKYLGLEAQNRSIIIQIIRFSDIDHLKEKVPQNANIEVLRHTTYSGAEETIPQDVVPQDIVGKENDNHNI